MYSKLFSPTVVKKAEFGNVDYGYVSKLLTKWFYHYHSVRDSNFLSAISSLYYQLLPIILGMDQAKYAISRLK